MKVRNGFVSNSSSSSFIVDNKDGKYTVNEVRAEVIELLKQYRDSKDASDWEKEKLSDEAIEGNLIVYGEEPEEWFKEFFEHTVTDWSDKIIIEDLDDNFIPFEVKAEIEQNFDLIGSCWHMG